MTAMWKEYHKRWRLGPVKYRVGDVVTKDGSDRYNILAIDYSWSTIRVQCVTAPDVEHKPGGEWTLYGDTEKNLIRRFKLVQKK